MKWRKLFRQPKNCQEAQFFSQQTSFHATFVFVAHLSSGVLSPTHQRNLSGVEIIYLLIFGTDNCPKNH